MSPLLHACSEDNHLGVHYHGRPAELPASETVYARFLKHPLQGPHGPQLPWQCPCCDNISTLQEFPPAPL